MFCSPVHTTGHTPPLTTMFFELPDGTRYQAKRTKRGQHLYAVFVQLKFPASDGSDVFHWTIASQHLTAASAEKASKAMLRDTPHLHNWQFAKATAV